MIDLGPPPQLYIPARPALIRAHWGDLNALTWLEHERGIKATLPGSAPIIVAASGGIADPGQSVFTSSGSFVVPDGYTEISFVAIGCGGVVTGGNNAGNGGDNRWDSACAVTPGETLTVTISTTGGSTTVSRGGTVLLEARGGTSGTSTATGGTIGGGNGGTGRNFSTTGPDSHGGGGGAGGYSGNGGSGGQIDGAGGSSGSGGAGGGGSAGAYGGTTYRGGAGGGVGLLGEGTSGTGGASAESGGHGNSGRGGSGGLPANNTTKTMDGGNYGGGAAAGPGTPDGVPGGGAVRFVWGEGRAYPLAANVGDV